MMTRHETVDLLSTISAYDNRNASSAAIHAWSKSADLGRWTLPEALDAVDAHFATSTAFLMPAHVTQFIKVKRRDTAMRQPVEPPDPAGQARLAKMIAGAFRDIEEPAPGELRQMHVAVSVISCPRCDAPIGKRCVNPITGRAARIPCLVRTRALTEVPS